MPTSSIDDLARRIVAHRNTREVAGAAAAIVVGWFVGKGIAGERFGFLVMLLAATVFYLAWFHRRTIAVLLPAVLAIPNLGLDIPGPWAVTIQDAFIVMCFAGYVTRAIMNRGQILPRDDRIAGPLFLFLGIAVVCISKVAALNPNNLIFNTKELMRLAMFSFLYLVVLDALDCKRQLMRLTFWILFWGVWMIVVSYYIYVTVSPFWYGILTMQPAYIFMKGKILRMVSIAGSTSYTGIYFATLLAMTMHYKPLFATQARRLWTVAYVLAILSCIALTFNRGTWVGMMFGFGVLLLQGEINRRRAALLILLAAGILALMTTSMFGQIDVEQRVVDFVHYSRGSAVSRLVRWAGAVNAVLDHPILGVGYNNFAFVYGRYTILETIDRQVYGSPHNMFVDVLTGTGLVGFSVFMLFIGRLWKQMRANMAAPLSPDLQALSRGIFMTFLFFLGSGLFDSFLFKLHHSSYLIVTTFAMSTAIRRLRDGTLSDPEAAPPLPPERT
jgi:O-antigen ligase